MLAFTWSAVCCILFQCFHIGVVVNSEILEPPYTEKERVHQYHHRGHTWPLQEYVPNTEGWKRLMRRRLAQVQAREYLMEKWTGFLETLGPALTTPNFTEFGWGLTHAPQELTSEVRQAVYDGLPKAQLEQKELEEIDGPTPLFIKRPDLTKKVSGKIVNLSGAMVFRFDFGLNLKTWVADIQRASADSRSLVGHGANTFRSLRVSIVSK